MKKNTFAWFVSAGAAIALSGMGMAACSSSSDATGNPTPTVDGGGKTDGSSTEDGGGPGTDGGTKTDGGSKTDGGTCTGSTPFVPEAGTANYCFGARSPEDAGNGCSGTTPSCCDVKGADGGFANSCVAQGSCPGVGTDGTGEFQCQDNGACGGSNKCCISKYDDWDGSVFDNTCGKFFGGGGTKCAANCDDSAQVCSSNADCPSGMTCKASKVASKNLGVCLP